MACSMPCSTNPRSPHCWLARWVPGDAFHPSTDNTHRSTPLRTRSPHCLLSHDCATSTPPTRRLHFIEHMADIAVSPRFRALPTDSRLARAPGYLERALPLVAAPHSHPIHREHAQPRRPGHRPTYTRPGLYKEHPGPPLNSHHSPHPSLAYHHVQTR